MSKGQDIHTLSLLTGVHYFTSSFRGRYVY
jgi:hypothetical protein